MGILGAVAKKKNKAEALAKRVIRNPSSLSELLEGISSDKAGIKFKSAKILRIISEERPELLYPKWDFFEKLLDSENNIIKWNAMDVIANLTRVDSRNRFDKIFGKFYGMLNEGSLITAAHVVGNSWKIARAKPGLSSRITNELLKVEKVPLPTEECRNILKGDAIISFSEYFDQIKEKGKVISFARRELKNSRNATRSKAEKFLKKFEGRK